MGGSSNKAGVGGVRGKALLTAGAGFLLKALTKKFGVGIFGVGVTDFHAADVKFKTLGKAGSIRAGEAEGRLAGGVVVDYYRFVGGQLTFDFVNKDLSV